MSNISKGDRVGAFMCAMESDRIVKFFGYGVYEGETVPPASVGGFNLGLPNPTIKLDNGKTCYGCEVWWGSEEKIRAKEEAWKAAGWTIETVDIDAERAKADAENAAEDEAEDEGVPFPL